MKNRKPQTYTVTNVPDAPDVERSKRMKRYALAMGIRTGCVALLVVLEGWLMWAAAVAAIFLPYFAVVLANEKDESPREAEMTPATLGLPKEL
jgi:hypothetical protein